MRRRRALAEETGRLGDCENSTENNRAAAGQPSPEAERGPGRACRPADRRPDDTARGNQPRSMIRATTTAARGRLQRPRHALKQTRCHAAPRSIHP